MPGVLPGIAHDLVRLRLTGEQKRPVDPDPLTRGVGHVEGAGCAPDRARNTRRRNAAARLRAAYGLSRHIPAAAGTAHLNWVAYGSGSEVAQTVSANGQEVLT